MSSQSVDLAEAITAALNDTDNEFVLQFNAQRRAAPFSAVEVEELKDLRVSVFTGATKAERQTRAEFKRTYKPVIAVQRKLNGATDEANLELADTLQELVAQIETRLEDDDMAGLSFFGFDEEQDREQYNVEALRDLGFFAVAIVLEYTDG